MSENLDPTTDLPVYKMARVHPLKLAHERLGNNLIRIVKILSSPKKKKRKSSTLQSKLPNFTFQYCCCFFFLFNSSKIANLPKQRNVKFP